MFKTEKIKFLSLLLGIFLISLLMSCSEKTDETSSEAPDNTDAVKIEEDNFKESNEDLLMVDYKEFYDALSPHGEWIEITDEEIGVDLEKSSASKDKIHRKISLAQFLGINDAHAQGDDFGAFFVWKPADDLAIGLSTDNPTLTVAPATPQYVPYTNGQWVYTDAGWYFQAPTPYEEIVHHYGRWTHSPTLGWVWAPGRVWSPAWVDWRVDDDFVAWSPLPIGAYIDNVDVIVPVIPDDRYVIVEDRYFVEPQIYKYMYLENKNKIMIKEMRKVNGVMVVDRRIINKGPDVTIIETAIGKPVPVIEINKVSELSSAGHKGNVINTFIPKFEKFQTSANLDKPVRKPGKFVSFEKKMENEKNKSSGVDNTKGRDDDTEIKGKENKEKGKGNEKNKGNENNRGKEKGKENENKDVKKQDSDSKQKGKDNKNDNSPKNKSNDKGKGKNK